MYLTLKSLHMLLAVVSVAGFSVRGVLALRQHPVLHKKWMRVVPHLNDTALLVLGISLAVMSGINPLEHSWLLAKLLALVCYVYLGMQVIRGRGSLASQWICFGLALATFAYMLGVAIRKNPVWFI